MSGICQLVKTTRYNAEALDTNLVFQVPKQLQSEDNFKGRCNSATLISEPRFILFFPKTSEHSQLLKKGYSIASTRNITQLTIQYIFKRVLRRATCVSQAGSTNSLFATTQPYTCIVLGLSILLCWEFIVSIAL